MRLSSNVRTREALDGSRALPPIWNSALFAAHTRIDAVVSEAEQIDLLMGGSPLVRLVWEGPAFNPLADGSFPVHYQEPAAPPQAAAASIGDVQSTLRKPPPGSGAYAGGSARALSFSIVNMQWRPVLVYAAVLQVASSMLRACSRGAVRIVVARWRRPTG